MKETERMKVKETVSRYKMIPKGSRVLVAVSGGADSMSLLNWLFENRGLYKAEIFAISVKKRGSLSRREEPTSRRMPGKTASGQRKLPGT